MRISWRKQVMAGALCASLFGALTAQAEPPTAYELQTLTDGLQFPWAIAFLPAGEFLVTEKPGALRRIAADGSVGPAIAGVPPVYYAGQGGLMDVVLDPAFAENSRIYLSLADGPADANATRVVRGVLEGDRLLQVEEIFRTRPAKNTPVHYGARLAFLGDGTLLITTGDGFDYRESAQRLDSQLGKVIRVHADGRVPEDNPLRGEGDPSVYSYGHRNPQGLVVAADGTTVYLHEHGPRGGDELNRIEPGANYGWPMATYGMDYSGAYVSPYQKLPGVTEPLHVWVPSIGPAGLALYEGQAFPAWRGDLFIGALVNQEVRRLDLEAGAVVAEEALFGEVAERIREVRAGPDGFLYLLTDSDPGRLIRVVPAD